MDEKNFKKLITEQVEHIGKNIDAKFAKQDKKIDAKFKEQDQNIKLRFAEQDKKIDTKFKEQAKTIDTQLEDQDILMQQYVGALGEEYQSRLQAALEVFTPLLALPEKVEEALRELRESNARAERNEFAIKEVLQNHEERIQVLER